MDVVFFFVGEFGEMLQPARDHPLVTHFTSLVFRFAHYNSLLGIPCRVYALAAGTSRRVNAVAAPAVLVYFIVSIRLPDPVKNGG